MGSVLIALAECGVALFRSEKVSEAMDLRSDGTMDVESGEGRASPSRDSSRNQNVMRERGGMPRATIGQTIAGGLHAALQLVTDNAASAGPSTPIGAPAFARRSSRDGIRGVGGQPSARGAEAPTSSFSTTGSGRGVFDMLYSILSSDGRQNGGGDAPRDRSAQVGERGGDRNARASLSLETEADGIGGGEIAALGSAGGGGEGTSQSEGLTAPHHRHRGGSRSAARASQMDVAPSAASNDGIHRADETSDIDPRPLLGGSDPTQGDGGQIRERLSDRMDLNIVVLWLEQALPFLLILFCFFLKEHLKEIALFAWLAWTFNKGNQIVRTTIAHRGANSNATGRLIKVVVCLSLGSLLSLLVIFRERGLWKSMILIPPPEKLNVWHSLFRCALCDVNLRQFGVVVKACQLLVWKPAAGKMFRRQGHFLTLVEHTTILYGLLLPIPIWYRYFQNTESFGQVLSSISTGCYLTMKLSTLFEKVVHFLGAIRVLWAPVDLYGTR